MHKLFSIAAVTLVVASCTSSGDRKATNTAPATAPITINTPTTVSLDSNKTGTVTTATPAPATTTNSANSVALNPEHGAPGHRCEIPVGAPLNSAPNSAAAPAPSMNAAPMMMKTQATPQPGNGNVRLNPEHGAPGHDCSIPVGQPLKS